MLGVKDCHEIVLESLEAQKKMEFEEDTKQNQQEDGATGTGKDSVAQTSYKVADMIQRQALQYPGSYQATAVCFLKKSAEQADCGSVSGSTDTVGRRI